jgi:hypothetical protein
VRNPFETDDTDADATEAATAEASDSPAPEASVPEATAPESSVPDAPSPDVDAADVDSGLRLLFWRLVLLYKFAVLGTTLGVLLLVFEAGPDIGVPLLVGSLVLFAYTVLQTKRGKERIDAGEFDTSEPGDSDEGNDGAAGATAETASDSTQGEMS